LRSCSTGPEQHQLGWLRLEAAQTGEGDAQLRHQDGITTHFRDKFVGSPIKQGKRPVMAGNDGLELEEALAGERRRLRPHGEAVPDGHDADLRAIDLVDQAHIREDRRVAHMVDCPRAR